MKYQIFTIIILVALINFSSQSVEIEDQRLTFDLTVNRQKNPWTKFDYYNDYCTKQLQGLDHDPNEKIFTHTVCKAKLNSKIEKNCELHNVAFNVDFYLNITSHKSWLSVFKKTEPLKMAIDLNTPWTWTKAEDCKNCSRQGSKCKAGCKSNVFESSKDPFEKYVNCNETKSCKEQDQCGQITMKNEGLAVQGKFVDMYVRFGEQKKRIQKYRMMLAYKTAFQQHLQSDGVLGLSPEITDKYKKEDDEDETTNYMENTGFINNLKNQFSVPNEFSLKLQDEPKLIVGKMQDQYAHDLEKYPFKYTPIAENQEYFSWSADIVKIEIMKFHENAKVITWENRHIIENFQNVTAQLSVSSTALVLPEVTLRVFIEKLNKIFGFEHCYVHSAYRQFLVCDNLKNPMELEEIIVYITLSPNISLHINPKDLVQNCRKMENKSDNYECILQIQESFDNHQIILGEVVLKNSYIHFDLENRQIGFAHLRSTYIKELLNRLENVIVELGEDVISELAFVARFYLVVIVLVIGFLSLRHGERILYVLNKMSVKFFNKRIMEDNQERQKLTQNEMELSVAKTDDDEHIGQRIFDMQIESIDQSATFEETNLDEL